MTKGLAATGLALLLTGCAGLDRQASTEPATPTDLVLLELAERLPGRYGTAAGPDSGAATRQITVVLDEAGPDRLTLVLSEQGREETSRDSVLVLDRSESGSPDWLDGTFLPLDASGNPGNLACQMRFRVRSDGLIGETDPDQCRFETGDQDIGLLKEIAFDGSRLLIADQLIDAADGSALHEPDVLRLHRLGRFAGRARVRDGGIDWRVASQVEVAAGGSLVEPLDAAGMSLGVVIDLDLIEGSEAGQPLLALRVLSEEEDQVLGQAWADPEAERLGLALPGFQISLRRLQER